MRERERECNCISVVSFALRCLIWGTCNTQCATQHRHKFVTISYLIFAATFLCKQPKKNEILGGSNNNCNLCCCWRLCGRHHCNPHGKFKNSSLLALAALLPRCWSPSPLCRCSCCCFLQLRSSPCNKPQTKLTDARQPLLG